MPTDPRDDFSAFAGSEHMLFGLQDPYAFIRARVLEALRQQVPNVSLDAIVAEGQPKFLTLGRRAEASSKMIVTFAGSCVRARVTLSSEGHAPETIDATLTLLMGHLDDPAQATMQFFLDVQNEAAPSFSDVIFKDRLLKFRVS